MIRPGEPRNEIANELVAEESIDESAAFDEHIDTHGVEAIHHLVQSSGPQALCHRRRSADIGEQRRALDLDSASPLRDRVEAARAESRILGERSLTGEAEQRCERPAEGSIAPDAARWRWKQTEQSTQGAEAGVRA